VTGQLSCINCPPNFYGSSPGSNSSSCTGPCPHATKCPGGCSSATPVLPGVIYTVRNGTRCQFHANPCPVGSSCSEGEQTPCVAGRYAPHNGSSFCPFCPLGQFQGSQGQASCSGCPEASTEQGLFTCTSEGLLLFGNNSWHDGLTREAGDDSRWGTSPAKPVANQSTKFYACGCKDTCCNVNSSSGNISCTSGSHGLFCSQCDDNYFKGNVSSAVIGLLNRHHS
jgi:hypothetical protein